MSRTVTLRGRAKLYAARQACLPGGSMAPLLERAYMAGARSIQREHRRPVAVVEIDRAALRQMADEALDTMRERDSLPTHCPHGYQLAELADGTSVCIRCIP